MGQIGSREPAPNLTRRLAVILSVVSGRLSSKGPHVGPSHARDE